MTYEEQFKSPKYYYGKINKLVDHYRENGYVNLVNDWEKAITKIADMPDLRRLADRANEIYYSYQTGAHK
ncbi:hypothetical protein [Synechococcus phage S-N03]|uniref:Uncharacterized protein n=1 Tax=Synechococcus phage S-N03 TaxID=2718943 RepID=A0A6G8R5Q1_9CAUD|nr:hypothetical protein PQC09_gp068 [Synechococcus phage S-N03]QIN96703.1 hypothetical protein [Synechococcus phage S-N03]